MHCFNLHFCTFVREENLSKDYKDWSHLKGTQELIQTLQILNCGDEGLESTHNEENALQGTPRQICTLRSPLCKILHNFNHTDADRLISGTYLHPDLVPSIAGWISPEFQLKANRVVNRYIVDEWKTKLEASERAASQLLTSLHQAQEIAASTELALQTSVDHNRQLQETVIEKIREKQVWSSTHTFSVLKLQSSGCHLPYI